LLCSIACHLPGSDIARDAYKYVGLPFLVFSALGKDQLKFTRFGQELEAALKDNPTVLLFFYNKVPVSRMFH